MTAQYVRTRAILPTEGLEFLDLNCGNGVETFQMAVANPGARILAIDASSAQIRSAYRRVRSEGFRNVLFHIGSWWDLFERPASLASLPGFNQFDLINCPVKTLAQDPLETLKKLRTLLKPEGILRIRLLNRYALQPLQTLTEALQILHPEALHSDPTPQSLQSLLQDFFTQLPPSSWIRQNLAPQTDSPATFLHMATQILNPAASVSIPELVILLDQAGLGIVSLIDLPRWDLTNILATLPNWLEDRLETLPQADALHVAELIDPSRHPILDLWVEPVESSLSSLTFPWSEQDWLMGSVQINPILRDQAKFRKSLTYSARYHFPFILQDWPGSADPITISPETAAWLAPPLLQGSTAVLDLLEKAAQLQQQAPDTILEDFLSTLHGLESSLVLFLTTSTDLAEEPLDPAPNI